ncbi:MAG: glutamate synthase large subunit [Verrucomicrobiales bacterium]|nr:glutamate synthase large subunit [Verrucomicrobiales bacterium]
MVRQTETSTSKDRNPATGPRSRTGFPPKQGLYDPWFEKDACGVGFVVHMKGRKSHRIIEQGLEILLRLTHRGACGAEPNTGDGAGLLLQIPHQFLSAAVAREGFDLPDPGHYGVGLLYLPPDAGERDACERLFERLAAEEGVPVIGWRTVPTDNSMIGKTALASEPFVRQVFVRRNPGMGNLLAFERKLYALRKRAHREIHEGEFPGCEYWYFTSLSSRTLVYKGMLMSEQLNRYFPDLNDPLMESALALVHSRFSTNTFPSWSRAHPYRYVAHNGEINTLRGNVNWMRAREALFESELFGADIDKIRPIINLRGSDSAMFDNCLELLALGGRPLPHAVMMMIPEPWENHEDMAPAQKAFYHYHAALMEPWDGPASIAFTDGSCIGAVLDRNGLRPSRYYVTKDDLVIMASEVGVLPVEPENVLLKGRLQPGRMFLVDMEEGRIIADEEVKSKMFSAHPYQEWLDRHLVRLEDLPEPPSVAHPDHKTVTQRQQAFGYTFEELRMLLSPMAQNGVEAVGSMGTDTPIAVLSERPQLLYNYFKQLFAQVTNPPIDCIREELITSAQTMIGSERNLLKPSPESCHMVQLRTPLLTNEELAKLLHVSHGEFKGTTIPILFNPETGGKGLEQAMEDLFAAADSAIADGVNILILSDRGVNAQKAPIPALLAVAGLHHHLIRQGTRTRVGIVLESGEPRETHHYAVLIGYGCSAINPYLAFETLDDMIRQGLLTDITPEKAHKNYVKAVVKGIVKVMSKMGISTVASYRGAQIFEAIGLHHSVIDRYFTWTPSRIEGIGIDGIAEEVRLRHRAAYPDRQTNGSTLPTGGAYQWREDGEYHLFNPETVHLLQKAARGGDYETYKAYAQRVNDQAQNLCTLRGLLKFKDRTPVPIDEVETIEAITRRFKTGAMSYGSISLEAHETLAIAMNRIGGRSNTGEGGEDPDRFTWTNEQGDSKCSAIKQVASGRFGVTSHYLVNSLEIQIKMAQGAKPGEGGQLPGGKVYPWVAKVRHSTPGVGLISPPPHHDIYSIEDLAELIHDLKNANTGARINVKLVAEVGVGTIAAGVAKGHADVILISGYDGGTGASPQTSIKHAGLPWELGLAETHQTLVLNDLRSRVVVETDGQMKTGRDVVIAALLGAEEFGFATAPLVTMGCILMRVCQKNTCPVGVATQDPRLRARFSGNPDHVVNFFRFVAREIRELMAQLGFRTIDEMIGHTEVLEPNDAIRHWKARGVDFTNILHRPDAGPEIGRFCRMKQDHGIEESLDHTVLLNLCRPAIENGEPVRAEMPIANINRVVGTITGSELTRRHGPAGLPEDTIKIHFKGSAGQSFAAFMPPGMTFVLEGDANDYIGKGLSGGRVIVFPPRGSTFVPEENVIVGNVAFYGATKGEAFIRGTAGERFCVRNSGVNAVVEGVGDHGCEYMTGGRVVVLGPTGRNFAAGMSGGIAYVLDTAGDFAAKRCNQAMVALEQLEDAAEIEEVRTLIQRHAESTRSEHALQLLARWDEVRPKFVKVIPHDYKRVLEAFQAAQQAGHSGDEAWMEAFEANARDLARVGGN